MKITIKTDTRNFDPMDEYTAEQIQEIYKKYQSLAEKSLRQELGECEIDFVETINDSNPTEVLVGGNQDEELGDEVDMILEKVWELGLHWE